MILVPIIPIKDYLVSNSVVGGDSASAYDAATAYSNGDEVIYNDAIYRSTSATATSGVTPAADSPNWVYVSKTNPLRMFEYSNGHVTTNADSIVFEFDPGQVITYLGFYNVIASSVRVTQFDATTSEVFFDEAYSMLDTRISGWHAYLYEPAKRKYSLTLRGIIPPRRTARIKVEILNTGATAQLGFASMGRLKTLGESNWGVNVGYRSNSIVEDDGFGIWRFTKKLGAGTMDLNFTYPTKNHEFLRNTIDDLDATPVMFEGAAQYGATSGVGFIQDDNLPIDNHVTSTGSITMQKIL